MVCRIEGSGSIFGKATEIKKHVVKLELEKDITLEDLI